MHENHGEDEVQLPLPNPPPNVINLDSKAIVVQVITPCPFFPPLPSPKKPSKAKRFPFIVLPRHTWVHGEVNSYFTNFLTYKSITKFLEFVEFYHVDHSDVMFIEFCSKDECVLMPASPNKTPFMCVYFTLFSHLHFIVNFDKF